jgi:hypothetical protein
MVTRIRNINPIQLAIVVAIIAAVIALVEAVLVIIFGFIGAFGAMTAYGMNPYGMTYGFGAIIIAPIVSGIVSFIIGLVIGYVYNFVAARTGGIEITMETVQTTATA